MTKSLSILLLFAGNLILAQPSSNSEIFVADISVSENIVTIGTPKNITNNPGYDNQPSFAFGLLLYAGTDGNQTEIKSWAANTGKTERINKATSGGEYSPQLATDGIGITAVRLDPDGLQRLYYYDDKGNSHLLLENLRVAYYVFPQKNVMLASVLSDNRLDLVMVNGKTSQIDTIAQNVGRSLHKIPDSKGSYFTKQMSYTKLNANGRYDIYQLNIETGKSTIIAQLPKGVQDHAWLDSHKMICGNGNNLFSYDLIRAPRWAEITSLYDFDFNNISRVAYSPMVNMLAFAAEVTASPGDIVQRHINPYNKGDLEGFANAFAEDVVVSRFPNDIIYRGRAKLKENYGRLFKNNSNLSVSVKKRIIIKNIVIDEEVATVNNNTHRQVTIYETKNGLIQSMTFIPDEETFIRPQNIVQRQLERYNSGDAIGFAATYEEDAELYDFPAKLLLKGHATIKTRYSALFRVKPRPHAVVKNRIVIGKMVIDEEFVTMEGKSFSAVAIYEIDSVFIARVTFIQ